MKLASTFREHLAPIAAAAKDRCKLSNKNKKRIHAVWADKYREAHGNTFASLMWVTYEDVLYDVLKQEGQPLLKRK